MNPKAQHHPPAKNGTGKGVSPAPAPTRKQPPKELKFKGKK